MGLDRDHIPYTVAANRTLISMLTGWQLKIAGHHPILKLAVSLARSLVKILHEKFSPQLVYETISDQD